MWVWLGDGDRARIGCPEWMEIDLDDVTIQEYRQIQRATVTPERPQGLSPQGLLDAWLNRDTDGFAAITWCAVRHSGVDPGPYRDFDFRLTQARYRSAHPDDAPEETAPEETAPEETAPAPTGDEAGKGDASPPPGDETT